MARRSGCRIVRWRIVSPALDHWLAHRCCSQAQPVAWPRQRAFPRAVRLWDAERHPYQGTGCAERGGTAGMVERMPQYWLKPLGVSEPPTPVPNDWTADWDLDNFMMRTGPTTVRKPPQIGRGDRISSRGHPRAALCRRRDPRKPEVPEGSPMGSAVALGLSVSNRCMDPADRGCRSNG